MLNFSLPASAAETVAASPAVAEQPVTPKVQQSWLKQVEAKKVCMANDKFMGSDQILTEFEGKASYGCCPMCAQRLKTEPALRAAVDPVSGRTVNKASAIIGAATDGRVYYFENETNLLKYANGPLPAAKATPGH